jgi:hypothetical protein
VSKNQGQGPDALEDFTLTIHPHDHAAATMQIDPDILTRLLVTLVHGGLSLTVGILTIRESSDHPPSGRPAPAPSSHHFGAVGVREVDALRHDPKRGR